jgi:capsular polysaccharide biosynthesis protein
MGRPFHWELYKMNDLLRTLIWLKKRGKTLLITFLAAGSLAFFCALLLLPTKSTAQVRITRPRISSAKPVAPFLSNADATKVFQSRKLAESAFYNLSLTERFGIATPDEITSNLTVSAPRRSTVITIAVRLEEAEAAVLVANYIAEHGAEDYRSLVSKTYARLLRDHQDKLAADNEKYRVITQTLATAQGKSRIQQRVSSIEELSRQAAQWQAEIFQLETQKQRLLADLDDVPASEKATRLAPIDAEIASLKSSIASCRQTVSQETRDLSLAEARMDLLVAKKEQAASAATQTALAIENLMLAQQVQEHIGEILPATLEKPRIRERTVLIIGAIIVGVGCAFFTGWFLWQIDMRRRRIREAARRRMERERRYPEMRLGYHSHRRHEDETAAATAQFEETA